MTTMAPLAMAAVDPPAEIAVTIKADDGHNPYIATGFGGLGKTWLATLTNRETKTSFALQVTQAAGVTEPPTAGQVCAALQGDMNLSQLADKMIAERFGYPMNGHGLAETKFVKGVLCRRAAGAKSVGLDPKLANLKKATSPTLPPATALLPPPPPPQDKRTKNRTSAAPVPPPPLLPPRPPAKAPAVASVLDF